MLKTMQIYQTCIFGVFIVFLLFFGFFCKFIKNTGEKLGSNRCPLFTMLTKQKFFNVLRSKLVKKTKGLPGLLSDPLSQGLCFSKESGLIILGDLPILKKSGPFSRVTCPHTLIMVYFQGRFAHTYAGLFSRATCPHILTLVYFQGRPAHIHSHCGLFSRATCPHILIVVYFQGRPAHILTLVYFQGRPAHTHSHWSIFTGDLPTHTHCGLFSGATCPHKLTLVYFHGRPALLIGLTWDPIWRFPLTRTKIGV